MAIAFPTKVMVSALDVVFSACVPARKVEIAVIADPVRVGIFSVLLQGSVISEPSRTANTVGHLMVVVQSQEYKRSVGTCSGIYVKNCMTRVGGRVSPRYEMMSV